MRTHGCCFGRYINEVAREVKSGVSILTDADRSSRAHIANTSDTHTAVERMIGESQQVKNR